MCTKFSIFVLYLVDGEANTELITLVIKVSFYYCNDINKLFTLYNNN